MRATGRHAERIRVRRITAAAHESSLIFVGDSGIGKTHLLESIQAASPIDAVLLRVNPAETAWPLSGFSAMLSSINDSRAVEFGGRFVLRSTEPEHMFAAARDLLVLIRGLALSPMLLLVDDIDLMDPESQVLVGFIAGRLGGTGIRLVATATRVRASGPFGGIPQETLEPLDQEDALLMVDQVVRGPADEGTLSIIAAQSDGNPRALVENLASLTTEQIAGQHPLMLPMVPGRTARTVALRSMEQLGRTQRAMLDRLSTSPLSLRSVAIATGIMEEDALHDLIYAGLVDVRGPFVVVRSATLRSHVYWSMSGKARREQHAVAATAYRDADSRIALWHSSFGDERVGAEAVMAAAVSLAREGQVAAAVEFAEHARRQAGDGAVLLTSLATLAETLFRRGELALASRFVEVGLAVADDSEAGRWLSVLRLKVGFLHDERLPDRDFDYWFAAYRTHPRACSEFLAIAALCLTLRWEIEPARSILERMDESVTGSSPSALQLRTSTARLLSATAGAPPSVDAPLPTTQSSADRAVTMIIEGRAASLAERYPQARRLFSIVLGQRPAAEPVWVKAAHYLLADNEIRADHFALARAAVADWRASSGARSLPATTSYLEAWSAYAEGKTADAHDLLTEGLGRHRADGFPAVTSRMLALKGELFLIEGDPDEAERQLSLADMVAAPFANPALVRHRADHIEAAALAGHAASAADALREFARRAAEHPSRWSELALGRARAALAQDELSLVRYDEATAAFRPDDSSLAAGRLHLAHAAKLQSLGMHADSRAVLIAARASFDRAGAIPWLRRVDDMLGLEPEAGDSTLWRNLSDDELQVVHLVQQGLRNKEIASRLYISVRTVELRLTHVYRKVGARSRSHLVSLMS